MTDQECADIIAERLAKWGEKLRDNHATPVALIGFELDAKEGQLVLCYPRGDSIDKLALAGLLIWAAAQLDPMLGEPRTLH